MEKRPTAGDTVGHSSPTVYVAHLFRPLRRDLEVTQALRCSGFQGPDSTSEQEHVAEPPTPAKRSNAVRNHALIPASLKLVGMLHAESSAHPHFEQQLPLPDFMQQTPPDLRQTPAWASSRRSLQTWSTGAEIASGSIMLRQFFDQRSYFDQIITPCNSGWIVEVAVARPTD